MPEALNVDVFIDFTPNTSGDYVIQTCNLVSYDSKLAIYSGACGAEVALACNDDATSCAGFSSRLLVSGLSSGASYKVQLGGYGPADTGGGQVDLSPAIPRRLRLRTTNVRTRPTSASAISWACPSTTRA